MLMMGKIFSTKLGHLATSIILIRRK